MIDHTLFGTIDKIKISIERLQNFESKEGYYLAFSGGKDSIVIKELANQAKVKYDAHYSLTTIDPPELVRFIKQNHSDIIIERPEKSFFQFMIKKGFPTRQNRWCCEKLKENGGSGRFVITGIRWAESYQRKNRRMIESCFKDGTKKFINPIIDWSDNDVWNFIKEYDIPYCKLYNEGWKRIGCLFCPMSNHRKIEVELYPKYKKAFIRAFEKLFQNRKSQGKKSVDRWKSGEEMFNWWINENRTKANPDQLVLFE